MSTVVEKMEAVTKYLWRSTVDFSLIYSKEEEPNAGLKWRRATSHRFKTQDDSEKFAAYYHEFAARCYKRKRDEVFEEVIDPSNGSWTPISASTGRILRFLIGKLPLTPANDVGQRWWQFVIASGPTHKAGCVIIARVAAKEPEELHKYIADLQAIMSK
jgi:hypothetical protein